MLEKQDINLLLIQLKELKELDKSELEKLSDEIAKLKNAQLSLYYCDLLKKYI